VRAIRLICDARVKDEIRERREARDSRDVTECADTAAALTQGVKIVAQGGSNWHPERATLAPLCTVKM